MARERYCHIRIPVGLVDGIRDVVKLTGNKYGYRSISEFVIASARSKVQHLETIYYKKQLLDSHSGTGKVAER